MIKLSALYSPPKDTSAFDEHFFSEHLQLLRQIPDLIKHEIAKVVNSTIGDTKYYLICDMYFDDENIMNRAMASPEGRKFAKDILSFAANNVSMMYSEIVE